LGSLLLCAVVFFHSSLDNNKSQSAAVVEENRETKWESAANLFLRTTDRVHDPVMEYYRNPEFKDWVIEFLTGICSNREIAMAILENTDQYNIPVALAVALAWEESRFNPRAVNRSNRDGSIDRGLFQLNNRSFPNLELSEFFNIQTNARYGISHLRHCLNIGGTEVTALAMYNAGSGRVNTSGAPRVTLNYISRIMENRSRLESYFHVMLIQEEENRLEERNRTVTPREHQFPRALSSASPL
jgi:hypothetical protein